VVNRSALNRLQEDSFGVNAVTLPAYAKVNLFLDVVGKRPDGYHELVTLFERVDLADEVTVEIFPGDGTEIRCSDPQVPCDRTNLAARAVEGYRAIAGWPSGVRIILKKQIPVAGGLGGGSSNAATTLLALQRLSPRPISQQELLHLAKGLGADVPFFLTEEARALGRGRGDECEPVVSPVRFWHLLAAPGFPIPTKAVYQAYSLTASGADVRLLIRALRDNDASKAFDLLFNALEPTVERLYPAIRHVKEAIRSVGGLPRPMVSGSGSTVMALCGSQAQAQAAAQALKAHQPEWQVFVAQTRE